MLYDYRQEASLCIPLHCWLPLSSIWLCKAFNKHACFFPVPFYKVAKVEKFKLAFPAFILIFDHKDH